MDKKQCFSSRFVISIIIIGMLFGILIMISLIINSKDTQKRIINVSQKLIPTSPMIQSTKWKGDKLVVIPAIWKEIDWANRSSWPLWLREGLSSQSYHVHLYQRIDPNSTAPYDWPYCANVHEEAGVYLKFIYDYYHDLPKKMLFIHGDPLKHSPHPIEAALCIRDDVHYVNINSNWFVDRPWSTWAMDRNDGMALMYKCASYLLTLFGFDADAQLNPDNNKRKDGSAITGPCCAQFFVTKERIQHYTYEQWWSAYHASLKPYCASQNAVETAGNPGTKWFGGSFEHLWHIILGLHSSKMPLPKPKTNSDLCHLFRSSCIGSPCLSV